jgi:hypothetical protein
MATSTRDGDLERSELVRELNQRIREIAGENGDDSYPYTFVCECGCWGDVRLTLPEFDRSPRVLRDGHGR